MKIPLTQGKFAIIDDEDWDKELITTVCGEKVTVRICDKKWCSMLSHGNYYAITKVRLRRGRRILFLHRIVLGVSPDSKLECDHINRNTLDNRRENLRWVTNSQNKLNGKGHKNSVSKFMGVGWHKQHKKWRSYIRFNGKLIHIGLFDNEIDAAKAYDRKKKELYGDSYSFNFQV